MHISREEFESIVETKKMFKLTDMFYGTTKSFEECFLCDSDYDSIVDFADHHGVDLQSYTEREHEAWLRERGGVEC